MSRKFKKEWKWLLGKQMLFPGYKLTGVWGAYSEQSRHHWFGIKGVIGFRYSISWGSHY